MAYLFTMVVTESLLCANEKVFQRSALLNLRSNLLTEMMWLYCLDYRQKIQNRC